MGERLATMSAACRDLDALEGLEVLASSSVYATSPVGPASGEFYNAVLRVRTRVEPHRLLDSLLAVEKAHGRVRSVHWGDRSLDLDLLLMGEDEGSQWLEIEDDRLCLPHPRIWERDFVLVPLAELDPLMQVRGQTLLAWKEALEPEQSTIRRQVAEPATLWPGQG